MRSPKSDRSSEVGFCLPKCRYPVFLVSSERDHHGSDGDEQAADEGWRGEFFAQEKPCKEDDQRCAELAERSGAGGRAVERRMKSSLRRSLVYPNIDKYLPHGYSCPMTEQTKPAGMLRHLAPPLILFLLAPLVAEYLLGDFRITQLGPFPLLAMTYGCGALLIRDLARRGGRGWPAFLLLAAAYGILAEGIVNQSLFNPNFMHLHLLAYGFLPGLGTSPFWAIIDAAHKY